MSNNQKAVKLKPSDSKNVIEFALLRSLSKFLSFFSLPAEGPAQAGRSVNLRYPGPPRRIK
jgi:hypothetical protein